MKKQSNQSQLDEQKQLSLRSDHMEKLFKELGLTIDESMVGKAFVMPFNSPREDLEDKVGAEVRNLQRRGKPSKKK